MLESQFITNLLHYTVHFLKGTEFIFANSGSNRVLNKRQLHEQNDHLRKVKMGLSTKRDLIGRNRGIPDGRKGWVQLERVKMKLCCNPSTLGG